MKNSIKEKIKKEMEDIVNVIKERPLTFVSYCTAFSTGLVAGIKSKDKSYQTQVLTTFGMYIFGTILGYLGFLGDEKLNNKKKAE